MVLHAKMSVDSVGLHADKRCPVCGHTMLGSRKRAGSRHDDYFECVRCEMVIDYSGVERISREQDH